MAVPSPARPANPAATPRRHRGYNALLLLFIVALGVGVAAAFASGRCDPTGTDSPCGVGTAPDLSKVLLPFVAIATAIERFWETLFGWYESLALDTARLIGLAGESAGWIKVEYGAAEAAVTTTADALAGQQPGTAQYDQAYAMFEKAESRLQDAQTRITDGLKAPQYVAVKQAIILLGSLVLGLAISVSARLYLFHKAGFAIPGPADLLVTGLLIGAGPGPLHEVIGLLQGLRDSVSGLASLAQGAAIKNATEAVGQAEATASGHVGGGVMAAGTAATLNLVIGAPGGQEAPAPPGAMPQDATAPPPPVTALPVQRQAQRLLNQRRP